MKMTSPLTGNRPLFNLRLVFTVLLLATMPPLEAQQAEDDSPSPPKLFSANDTLNVTITAPWRDVERKKDYQGTYPGKIEYTNESGESVSVPLTVERRGITRQRVCRYPPIKLRFEKESAKGTTFRGQKSLKMVTHCQKNDRYEQYYIMEMLTYLMYNLINDYSFRIRPLNVNYVDSASGKTDEDRFAFLIEDDSDVAERNDLKKLVIGRVKPTQLEPRISSEFSLFQYMIGNVDWAALRGPDPEECCHNVKLIAPRPLEPDDMIIPVPYDFDSAGIVNADYAAPPEGLPIQSVTQRLFRGYCLHNETLEDARKTILEHENAIYALVNDQELLAKGSKRRGIKYLEKFFEIIKDEKDFNKLIISKCRK